MAAVVIAVVIARSASSDPAPEELTSAGKSLDNGDAFLQNVQAQWRSTIPVSGVTLSQDPACFYLVDRGTTDLIGSIACGGIRRTQSGPEQVWDIYGFETVPRGEDAMHAAFAELRSSGESVGARYDLVGVDGAAPADDVTSLAEPPMPTVDPGFARTVEGTASALHVTVDDAKEPGDAGLVRTPGGSVEVRRAGTTESVPARGDSGMTPHAAPQGSQLYVVELLVSPRGDSTANALQLFTENQGKTTQIYEAEADYFGDDKESLALVIAASQDSPPKLLVSSDGHQQTIDLATGAREPDDVADTFYRSVTEQDLSTNTLTGSYTGKLEGDATRGSLTTRLTSARLTAHTAREGWAEPGRAWLVVRYDDFYRSSTYDVASSAHHTWTVTTDTGEEVTHEATSEVSRYETDSTVAIDVPADATTYTVSTTATVKYDVWGYEQTRNLRATETKPVDVTFRQ